MKLKNNFSYLFRKYNSVRFICLIFVCLAVIGLSSLVSYSIKDKPIIFSVSNQVGLPGDTITIRGKFFNKAKSTSFVEISGNRLTESSYISWNDNEIVVTIPQNIQDGLIYVVSKAGRSNPDFFANKSAVPISIEQNNSYIQPVISSLSREGSYVGELLTITGRNFGTKKDSSNVFFSTKKTIQQIAEKNLNNNAPLDETSDYIAASNIDFDYEYWSDNEIKVFVPDGAATGYLYVQTENGTSQKHTYDVYQNAGKKEYLTKTMYLVQVAADFSNIKGTKDSVLSVRLPLPSTTSEQPVVTLTESEPKPLLENYDNTSVFQIVMDKTGENSFATAEKTRVSQNHVVTVRSVQTEITPSLVTLPKNRNRLLYKIYTRQDEIVPADDAELVKLLPKIIYQSKNPYFQAKLIYDYMIANYKIEQKLKKPSADYNVLEMITTKRGDTYDFAVLYAALLRTAGIPAKLMSGILIDAEKKTIPHWWVNFYLENFGWVPADPALGAGFEYNAFQKMANPATFYFGNLDSQHIVFTQNWNIVKNAITDGKTVSIPKSYATQSIWEESSKDISSYSSFWNVPAVLGVY